MKNYRTHVLVCAGTACFSNHAMEIKTTLEGEIRRHGLEDEVQVVTTGCNGFCERGTVAVIQPDDVFYQQLRQEDVPHLVEEHFLKGRPVEKLMYVPEKEEKPIPKMMDIPSSALNSIPLSNPRPISTCDPSM